MYKVFTYGSLKKDFWNNNYLRDSKLIHVTAISCDKYVLQNEGIPYAIPKDYAPYEQARRIIGEIWEVDEYTLHNLDCLEGHPSWYNRQLREFTVFSDTKVEAWIYEYPKLIIDTIKVASVVGECYEWQGRY